MRRKAKHTELMMMRAWSLTLLAIAALASAAPANAAMRTWSTSGEGTKIVALDCEVCHRDIGIIIACKGPNRPAEVTVHWVARETGRNGATVPLMITIDHKAYNREATIVHFDETGYAPRFEIVADDPLFEAMQSGAAVAFSNGRKSVSITLNGSRDALAKFRTECGWARR